MSNIHPDRADETPGPDHLKQSYDEAEAFNVKSAQGHARLVRVVAGRLQRIARGNPSMSGPSPQDIHRARDMVAYIERLGYVVSYDPSRDLSRPDTGRPLYIQEIE